MAVYYYNGDKILAPFTIVSNRPVFASDTVSLKHIRVAQEAQRWELGFNTLGKDTVANAFLELIGEIEAPSTMVMPQFPEVDSASTATGVATASSAHSAGSSLVSLDASFASGFLPKGSFVKFAGHNKVYILQSDLDFDSASTVNAEIYPNLTIDVALGSSLGYGKDCKLTYFRDIDNLQGVTFADGLLASQGTINLIEAL